ncbi:MAG: hypothetical protein OEX22_04680 [Cyclobacteriaceae bacterium]|nr:hypothetical protein [Cyclobacteriaceae bacterium]
MVNYFNETLVKEDMKLSLKNIAITLGIVAGATVAAVITSKNVKKPSTLFANNTDAKEEEMKEANIDQPEDIEEDILYV